MKLTARHISGFMKRPDADVAGVLIYGPDTGQVRERLLSLKKTLSSDNDDPFAVTELSEDQLKQDPAILADEITGMSLLGGRRIIIVREAGDKCTKLMEPLVDELDAATAYLIVCGGDLPKRSSLRKLFEDHKQLASLPCYKDEDRDIAALIQENFRSSQIMPEDGVVPYLVQHLGNDRFVTRNEIEKIILYQGEDKRLSLQTVERLVGHNQDVALDAVALQLASGDLASLDVSLSQAFHEGVFPVVLLRACLRHFQRLYQVARQMNQGIPADKAMATLRPPIFFRHKESFARQLRLWNEKSLILAMDRLNEAELACKQTGAKPELVCHRAMMAIAASKSRTRQSA